MELVERDAALQRLEDRLRAVAGGSGHVVLVGGEAGIGKTSLLQALAARRADADLWWGACDALQTPQPLAPLHDIARASETGFQALLQSDGPRAILFGAVLTELQQSHRPTLLVVEDVHWADDATLDLLKFLGRRIDRAPCLLALTWRDDEVAAAHPLRRVLGELPASLVTRIELPRLSPESVDLLARRALRSSAGIHAATRGNPFFVTELLRHGIEGVPNSVRDLVLARYSRLGPGAQAIVRLASVVPAKIERWLVEQLLAPGVADVEECLDQGLLTSAGDALGFRHELARVAVESSLSPPVASALHAGVLGALKEAASVSMARLVHHAIRAGDVASVLACAPEAARQAQQRGAHREAAAHYRTALEHVSLQHASLQRASLQQAGNTTGEEIRRWLQAYADECQVTDQLDEATAARLRLDELCRRASDAGAEAENLSQLALVHVLALRNAEADAASRRAIELLEALPPGLPLARAYRVEAQLRMLNRDCEDAVAWGSKAIGLAERFDDRETLAAALSAVGAAMLFIDYDAGCAHLQRGLVLALAGELHYIAANIHSNFGSGSGEVFRLLEAERHLLRAIAFAQAHEIDFYRNYCVSWLALCELHLGRWDDAREHALDILQQTTHRTTSRVMALVALGRVLARRGDPGAGEVLDEALELALASATLQRIAPVRAARAEAAWLRGDLPAVIAEARPALALAMQHRHPWFSAELAWWMHRAGALDAVPATPCAPAFALQIEGRWREAADAWSALGCPYEQARALDAGSNDARVQALAMFEQLGARPDAARLRRELTTAGVRLPRGARPSTQANPHQLTVREAEVLGLLCEGLKNSEIAERLCRSVRTIDHHLAAVFAKLGVGSRTEAVAAALHAGIGPQNGQGEPPN